MSNSDWKASLSRMLEVHMQVRNKSGPIYDKCIENTRIYGAAWREAGRPRQVSQLHHVQTQEITYFYTSSLRNRKKGQDIELATEEDWLRWENWKRQRDF